MKKVGFCQAVQVLGENKDRGESIVKKLKKPGCTPFHAYKDIKKYAIRLQVYCSVLAELADEKMKKIQRKSPYIANFNIPGYKTIDQLL